MAAERSQDDVGRGPPSNSKLSERLARVEEKQDHVVDQIDRMAETLDDDLTDIETVVTEMKPRHDRLWHVYRASKWMTALLVSGGLAGRAIGLL